MICYAEEVLAMSAVVVHDLWGVFKPSEAVVWV